MKFEITGTGHDSNGKYHGTVHKERDGSCHVIASNKSRSIKSKMVRKGFWKGTPFYEDKEGRYANEVNFAYHNFCENDEYNQSQPLRGTTPWMEVDLREGFIKKRPKGKDPLEGNHNGILILLCKISGLKYFV